MSGIGTLKVSSLEDSSSDDNLVEIFFYDGDERYQNRWVILLEIKDEEDQDEGI
jgi:hypothetical protein